MPKKQILSIWSVIHLFFSEIKYNNIKVIVPFDRAHINNAFKELNSFKKETVTTKETDKTNGSYNNYANDYINKTFDIVFRVAPPILSSWKDFFKDKWKDAFPIYYDEIEYIKTIQAYEVLRPKITPREIIAFINEVVALKLIDKSIPDRYISIFVLNKEKIIENPLNALIDLSYLDGLEHSYKSDPDYQKYITALSYQIEADRALEVVYRSDLKNSLMNKNVETIDKISKMTVFSKILHSIILELSSYENAIEVLDLLSEDANISKEELEIVWDDIYLRQKNKKLDSGSLESFYFILLNRIHNSYKSNWLRRIINNLYSEEKGFNALSFVSNIDKLVEFCLEKSISLDVYTYLSDKKISLDNYKAIIDKKKEDYTKYKLFCPKDDVIAHLNDCTADNFHQNKFVFYLDYRYQLSKIQENIKTFISDNSDDLEYLKNAIPFLKEISEDPIGEILTESELYKLIQDIDIKDELYIDLVCMIIVFTNPNNGAYSIINDYESSIKKGAFFYEIANEMECYIHLDDLLIHSISSTNNLLKDIIPFLFKTENKKRAINVNLIIENMIPIIESNKVDSETIFSLIDKYDYKDELDYEFVSKLDIEFFEIAKASNSNIARLIINIYLDNFKKANDETFKIAFNNLGSKELNILLLLNFNEWNSFALDNFKKKLLDISNNNDPNISRIPPLIDNFEKSNQNLMLAFIDMRESYISNNNISNEHFSMFMPYLFEYGKLEERPADIIRTVFKSVVLDDPNCVSVMIEHSDDIKSILDQCEKSEKIDFISAVKDRSENEQIFELAEKLDIKIEKQRNEK